VVTSGCRVGAGGMSPFWGGGGRGVGTGGGGWEGG